MESNIYPTGTCFDDMMEFIEKTCRKEINLCPLDSIYLAHGILEPGSNRFAHAWVRSGVNIIQSGYVYNNKKEKVNIFFGVKLNVFINNMKPVSYQEYNLEQVVEKNQEYGNYGPWEPEYLALCKDNMPKNINTGEIIKTNLKVKSLLQK